MDVDGFVIDLVRDNLPGGLLIEIQTRGFSNMKRKLHQLLNDHRVRVVYPIAAEKWIVRLDANGNRIGRRKSPKRGAVIDVAAELVSFPTLLDHPNFTLDVLLIQEEEHRRKSTDRRRGWRRKGWLTHERRLLKVVEQHTLTSSADLCALLPDDLPDPFTTADIAAATGRPRRLAQQIAYCLRESGALETVGKRGNAWLYRVV
ncbi:MAG: hypothetical protein K8S97_04175 [Anaerolineae bacterium]|nr:hypothetical protein [Anaerolineae bacterium]